MQTVLMLMPKLESPEGDANYEEIWKQPFACRFMAKGDGSPGMPKEAGKGNGQMLENQRSMPMDLQKKLETLEYHQELLLQILENPREEFSKLIVRRKLSREEVEALFRLCEEMSIKMEEQKAEGLVYFAPLFQEFSFRLNQKLDARETVEALRKQELFSPLMDEFRNYL